MQKVLKRYMLLLFCFFSISAIAQQKMKGVSASRYQSSQNDSLVFRKLEEIDVYPRRGRNLNYRRYSRLVAKIRKVYPFALDAAKELELYNQKFENTDSERDKRRYVRYIEKELFVKHEEELKKFTISEGQYLMLLIDRETGNSSYSIIKEIKGGVPALFWQGIAKIFNNDLKKEYDPVYTHYVIEQIVQMIELEKLMETSSGS